MKEIEPKAIKPSEAMRRYAIPRDRLYNAIANGELPAIDLSTPGAKRKTYTLLIKDIEEWLEKLKNAA